VCQTRGAAHITGGRSVATGRVADAAQTQPLLKHPGPRRILEMFPARWTFESAPGGGFRFAGLPRRPSGALPVRSFGESG